MLSEQAARSIGSPHALSERCQWNPVLFDFLSSSAIPRARYADHGSVALYNDLIERVAAEAQPPTDLDNGGLDDWEYEKKRATDMLRSAHQTKSLAAKKARHAARSWGWLWDPGLLRARVLSTAATAASHAR